MGCGKSKSTNVVDDRGGEAQQLDLPPDLRESWAIVDKQLEKLAKKWFLEMFQKISSTLDLFHFKNERDLENSKWLRLHAIASWRSIGRVVKTSAHPETALAEVRTIARAHTSFNLNQQVFDVAKSIFLRVLEDGLGPSVWNESLKSGYERVFDLISDEMLSVIENRKTKVQEEELSRKERNLAEGCDMIEQDLDKNAAKFITRLIDSAPDAVMHLPYKQDTGYETVQDESMRINQARLYQASPQIANDPELIAHGKLMLKTFGRIARGQKTLAVLDQELRAIGKTHQLIQMRPELFVKAGEALLWLLGLLYETSKDASASRWDEERQQDWKDVVRFVVSAMTYPDAERNAGWDE